jgi:signal transduction histidine kinase
LPAGLDLTAYRIVQEALTNVRKHAHADRVDVHLRYASGAIEIEVVDDGVGAGTNGAGGHGLIGMRERVALYGGEVSAGAVEPVGYRIHATLPAA